MITSPEPILVVAVGGIDPSGGSGIGRDAATLASIGATPILIATATTVQDTGGVHRIEPIDAGTVAEQLAIALRAGARSVKLGMLHRPSLVEAIIGVLRTSRVPVVVDPVLEASAGGALGEPDLADAIGGLREVATVVTPNRREAERLLGGPVRDAAEAAARLAASGWHAALVTGGEEDATDHLCAHGELSELAGIKRAGSIRGTGCAYAALIAAGLASGDELEQACRVAKGRIGRAIANATAGMLGPIADPVWSLAGHPFE